PRPGVACPVLWGATCQPEGLFWPPTAHIERTHPRGRLPYLGERRVGLEPPQGAGAPSFELCRRIASFRVAPVPAIVLDVPLAVVPIQAASGMSLGGLVAVKHHASRRAALAGNALGDVLASSVVSSWIGHSFSLMPPTTGEGAQVISSY